MIKYFLKRRQGNIFLVWVLGLGFAFCFNMQSLIAQPTYMMQNLTVDDCEGTLMDSEAGPEAGQYDHNEDFTFTICVDNADEIIIAFEFFSTEDNYDILAVYDGPNINSPLLASLTGVIQPPPVIVATSGCVTFHFISDDNIVAAGWQLNWMVEIDDPVPPVIEVISMLDCPMDAITFQFDFPVDCDVFTASNFSIIGPGGPSIAQVNPLDCVSGELGQLFEVVFNGELAQSGTYRLLFNGAIQDVCGDWHDVNANVVFDLTNCPFTVEIELENSACEGDCGQVEAVVIGGDVGATYNYMWGHTLLNQSIVNICTGVAVDLFVTVTNPASGEMVIAQYNYIPLENPVILNPIQDTVCSSMGDHFYQSSLPGGLYTSAIIPDWLQDDGRYQFWRWQNTNTLNTDVVTYTAPNGCVAYDTVLVLPVNTGSVEAACLGAPDFIVNGGTPAGGIWQGPHISANGTFSPAAVGSFVVNYTAPNGCVGYKRVNVEPGITMPDVDTICSSQEFDLAAIPYGGWWTGPGIVNGQLGRIRPWNVASNQTYSYVYTMQGCTDTIDVFIQELWAGPDFSVCKSDSLIFLNQVGDWSGPGIYIPLENAFDISMLGPGSYDYMITAFGCTDVFTLYIEDPYADPYDPISFCQEDTWYPLSDYVDYGPNWGTFTGPTIGEFNDEWYFNPELAGGGVHTIYFEAVGCLDSFTISVEQFAVIPDYSFCELSPAQLLMADPPGGTWAGPGFLDGASGLFDPQLLPPGIHYISYLSSSGCLSLDSIEIILREAVSISGVNQLYCSSDTVINIVLAPLGGDFFINGIPSPPQFNPSILGTGTHELFYTRGTGPCGSVKRIFFSIMPPINGIPTDGDSICINENTVVALAATGGTGTLSYNWDQGLGFGSSHIVSPSVNTLYTVTVTDGCSEPFTSTAFIYVHQPFDIDLLTGPAVCYDDTSFIEIVPPIPGQYLVQWQLDTVYESPYLEGNPGIYEAEITELFSGCKQTFEVQIPGPPPLSANFTIIPNQPCIDIVDNTVQVIDLATGYTEGFIDFGDGSGPLPYVQGEFIEHDYEAIGDFLITLIIANDLGCMDTSYREICVENVVLIYVPNIFSPNGDGNNDEVKIQAFGMKDIKWNVFTRWGENVFEADNFDIGWDGTNNGQPLDPGVFVVHINYTNQETGKLGWHTSTVTLVK